MFAIAIATATVRALNMAAVAAEEEAEDVAGVEKQEDPWRR